MSKLKTKKSLVKRLKITKKGKVIRRQSFRRHIKATKTKKQLRNLKRVKVMTGYYAKKILKAVGKK